MFKKRTFDGNRSLTAVRATRGAARKAFAEATRKAAAKALDAGLSVPGRVRGRRVRVLPDGSIFEAPPENE